MTTINQSDTGRTASQTRSITRRLALATAPVLALALASCATPFRADVNRFQNLPAPQGQTFFVTSSDPKLQGGIEFSQYAGLVAQEMSEEGYVYASDPASADMVVSFSYGIDDGREKIRSNGSAFGSFGYEPFGYYNRRRAYAWGFYDPFIYGPGYSDISSYTVYTSSLDLTIDRVADNRRLFEGKAEAQSRSKNLQYIVPNLVEAIFTEFPGQSGETLRISIAPEETTVRTVKR